MIRQNILSETPTDTQLTKEAILKQAKKSLTDVVIEHVRSEVLIGRMVPEEWYSVYKLADELGFSRSPVRDGLLRLEEAGLIRFVRNRGFRVVPTSPADVAEIFSVRLALEVPAARRATLFGPELSEDLSAVRTRMEDLAASDDEEEFFRLDRKLHALILSAGGARRTREVVERLRSTTRLLGASTARGKRTLHTIVCEHDPIIDAIEKGDSSAAGEAMQRHLVTTARLLIEQAIERSGSSEDAEELWASMTAGYDLGHEGPTTSVR